ncbi:MAG: C10 family peptidase [Prevotella sp.]|jgi:hypothetical protein
MKHIIKVMPICAMMLLSFSTNVNAAPRDKASMKNAAAAILAKAPLGNQRNIASRGNLKLMESNESYSIYGYEKGGFAIISNDDLVPEVIGYSQKAFKDSRNTNFKWYLEAVRETIKGIVASGQMRKTTTPDPAVYPTEVQPLVTSEWGQESPYNDLCPEGTSSGTGGWQGYGETGRCVTGCVATAMAQVLYYHQWPDTGTGTHSVQVKQADGSYITVTVDFSQSVYDWGNMIDDYNGSYTEAQGQAVAKLMLDCGVASDMQYATDGSGTYTYSARDGLVAYFGFPETVRFVERDDYSESDWMNMIYEELSNERPIIYGGVDMMNGGHEFVFCGYDAQGRVYVNWGWEGDSDGYYDVALLDPSAYSFSSYQDMIIGVDAGNRNPVEDTVDVTTPGELSTLIADTIASKITLLKVNGNINSTDIKFIRSLAGVDSVGESFRGTLRTLDLSDATIVAGGEPYLIDNTRKLTTTDNQMPERSFYGSRTLRTLLLPNNTVSLQTGALSGIIALDSVSLPTGEDKDYVVENRQVFTKDTTTLIAMLPKAGSQVQLREGTKVIGPYALASMHGVSELIIPVSVDSLAAYAMANASGLKTLRVMDKRVPATDHHVFTGISADNVTLYVRAGWKEAFARSANWSVFTNVKEFGTTIRARNTRREYGEPNPTFGYRVYGDYVSGTPEITCDADETTPAGKYTIHISRGTIESETVDFEDGVLTITKATANLRAVSDTIETGEEPQFAYTVDSLKNGETEVVMTVEPTFTVTDASGNAVSMFNSEGEFTIMPDSAESENYEFNYFPATLYVKVASGITNLVSNDDNTNDNVYSLTGTKVAEGKAALHRLPAGIYIYKGKKIVVR